MPKHTDNEPVVLDWKCVCGKYVSSDETTCSQCGSPLKEGKLTAKTNHRVAVEIMGWKYNEPSTIYIDLEGKLYENNDLLFASDMNWAMQVVVRLREKGVNLEQLSQVAPYNENFQCIFGRGLNCWAATDSDLAR